MIVSTVLDFPFALHRGDDVFLCDGPTRAHKLAQQEQRDEEGGEGGSLLQGGVGAAAARGNQVRAFPRDKLELVLIQKASEL